MKKSFFLLIIACLLLLGFTPQRDIQGLNEYSIVNFTDFNGTRFFGNFSGNHFGNFTGDHFGDGSGLTNVAAGNFTFNVSNGSVSDAITTGETVSILAGVNIAVSQVGSAFTINSTGGINTNLNGTTAGGDLSGTYPFPNVVDNSHLHTAANISNPLGLNVNNSLTCDLSEESKVVNWTGLQNYPSACPGDAFITTLGDVVTCAVPDNVNDFKIINLNVTNSSDLNGNATFDMNTLFVDADNNLVGIGTNTPSNFKLQVLGNIGPNSDSAHTLGSSSFAFSQAWVDSVKTTSVINVLSSSSGLDLRDTNVLGFISFNVNNGEAMRINASGFVGIGTSNPQSALDVSNSVLFGNNLTVNDTIVGALDCSNITGATSNLCTIVAGSGGGNSTEEIQDAAWGITFNNQGVFTNYLDGSDSVNFSVNAVSCNLGTEQSVYNGTGFVCVTDAGAGGGMTSFSLVGNETVGSSAVTDGEKIVFRGGVGANVTREDQNITINVEVVDTDTTYSENDKYLTEVATVFGLDESVLNITIDARENDTTYSENDKYLTEVATVFGLDEGVLNQTIDARENDTLYTAGTYLNLTGTQFFIDNDRLFNQIRITEANITDLTHTTDTHGVLNITNGSTGLIQIDLDTEVLNYNCLGTASCVTQGSNMNITGSAHTVDTNFSNQAAGGDLSGTYPNPSVVSNSHAHSSSSVTIDGANITSGVVVDARISNTLTLGSGSVVDKGALANTGTLGFDWSDSEVSDTLTASIWDGESNQIDLNVNLSVRSGRADEAALLNWTNLRFYPSACPANSFVTTLDDSITCAVPDNVNAFVISGDLNVSGVIDGAIDCSNITGTSGDNLCTVTNTDNQNLFETISSDGTAHVADSSTDTFSINNGSGISIEQGTDSILINLTTGILSNSITGNSGTATALAANGANCGANNYPLGVDASGAVESCTADANTEYNTNLLVNTTGDSMTGNLDMGNNNFTDVGVSHYLDVVGSQNDAGCIFHNGSALRIQFNCTGN